MNKRFLDPTVDYSTLVELLRWRAIHQPNQRAYTFLVDGETEEIHWTYGELDRRARAIGALLQSLEATGERVLLLYPSGLDYIAAFFGCLYAGVIAVPSYPPRLNRPDPRLQAIVTDSQATIVLTDTNILSNTERRFTHSPELESLRWLATDDLADHQAEEWQKPAITPDTLAFLQYTSGSTATPKGVMVSHANIMYNERMIQQAFGHTDDSLIAGWLPIYHDMGLIGDVLQPLYIGAPCVLMSPVDFLQKPVRWLNAISRYKAHTSGGPNFAYDLCVGKITPEQRATLDLSNWKVAFNGAEPIRHQTLERFAAAFASCGLRWEAFYPCYGLAEATLFVSANFKLTPPTLHAAKGTALEQHQVITTSAEDKDSRSLVGCGRTWLDQKIAIVNPESLMRCPPDQVGEIWVAGPNVAQGYWKQPEETERTFRAHLADTADGPFLRTGDLGFLKDGELFVTGRAKDLIIIRGRNCYPQDIELTVEHSHPALRLGCGAAFSVDVEGEERLVVAQEVERTQRDVNVEDVARAIRQAVADEHELQTYAVVLLKPTSIPKTSSGKIQRRLCRARFLEGSLEIIGSSILDASADAAPDRPQEMAFIRKALTAVSDPAARHSLLVLYLQEQAARVLRLAPSQVDVEQPLSALGLDSLMAVGLKHEIETSLGVTLPVVDLLQGPTIAHLAAQIAQAYAAPPTAAASPIVPVRETTAEHPLSRGQRALWFLHQLAPASAAYTIANAVRIRSELDVPALQRALQKLGDRHPALRTTFPAPDGKPIQHIHDQTEVSFQVEDAATWDATTLNERLAEEAQRPFDLEKGPLLRVLLFDRSAHEHVLLLVIHHIVADFWSLAVLVQDLGSLYTAEHAGSSASLSTPPVQYSDYAHWQAQVLAGPEGERLWAYWQQQLAGELPVLNLPTDRPRPAVQTYRGNSRFLKLDGDLTERLKTLARQRDATLYTILLAAFQTLLHRYTGQTGILVGSPMSNRNQAELAGLVGYFVNPATMRADLSGNPPFAAFLDQVRQTVLGVLAHQEYPFDLLVERLQPERDLSRSPIFQVMFTLQQSPFPDKKELAAFALGKEGARIDLGELTLESVTLEQQTAQFDLTLVAAETADGLALSAEYNSDLFEADTIERMLAHLQTLLAGIAADPERRISDLPLLAEAERRQLLKTRNDTRVAFDRDVCLHRLFAAQAERTPDEIAVAFDGKSLTYRQLDRQANQLARYLRARGVKSGDFVGVCMERSLEMVIGLLGALKAGGAYIPLDPTHPTERLAYVFQDAQVEGNPPLVLLTQERLRERFPQHLNTICVDTAWGAICQESEASPDVQVSAEHLAYTIYTSGSTGRPKGVQIPHRAVVNFLHSMRHEPGFTSQDVLLAVTTLSFDIAGLELFLPLTTGGQVVLASHEDAADGVRLAHRLAGSGATVMQATPATWRLLLETGWQGDKRLKALCGGEAFPRELANRLAERVSAVWNMYGPTETTIWSAVQRVEAGDGPVSLGHPIENTQIYLLDRYLDPPPVGVAGELTIGGEGLAWGYHNRPALTAEKFVPHPFSAEPGARLYRTGDLARCRSDGTIEFLGRVDYQVKIRGFRIELGEIEAALAQHPAVREAAVLAREDVPGDKRLVAYVVAQDGQTPTTSELRRFLREKLPDYMLPAAFVMLERLPLTPNSKLDRRALPAPDGLRPELEAAYVAPRSKLERAIAQAWREALQVEKIGVHDNFFDLGGHSLLMAQIHNRLQKEAFGQDLTIVELFQYPTIHSLVKYVSRAQDEGLAQPGHERIEIRGARRASQNQQRQRRQASRAADK